MRQHLLVYFDILACGSHSVVRSADHKLEKRGFTHVRLSNLLGGHVITLVVLIFQNMDWGTTFRTDIGLGAKVDAY